MKRTICVVTGGRAEYGLLRWVMQGIKDHPDLILQVVATGTHLSPEFGLTYKGVEADGFVIDRKIEMLTSSDTATGVTKSMGLGLIGFADALQELHPDLIVLLGDRFEIFAAAAAALIAQIPVAHLHGGELTEGAFDDALRHAITKMSHLHFVAAEEYQRRVIQLGEQPRRVHLVGALGIDNIRRLKLLDRGGLEASLGVDFGAQSLLITFHPVTLSTESSASQMGALLGALGDLDGTQLIFTFPNADTDGRILIDMVHEFVKRHPTARVFPSLGQLHYLSCLAHVDGVVGNSSSGLLEAPSLGKGTVNIGDRQRGRLRADSVIDCEPTREHIAAALQQLFSPEFKVRLQAVRNPHGEGGASEKVVRTLASAKLDNIIMKTFHDIPVSMPREY